MECYINGKPGDVNDFNDDPLAQALVISLFSWRKSNDDDGVTIPNRQGWWADSFANNDDRIGSRLWLLRREKLTGETIARAEEYAAEALQWLIDDAVISRFEVRAERGGMDRLDLLIDLYKPNDELAIQARFANVWSVQ